MNRSYNLLINLDSKNLKLLNIHCNVCGFKTANRANVSIARRQKR